MVGVGYGKAKEVPAAIAKGVEEARKSSSASVDRWHDHSSCPGRSRCGRGAVAAGQLSRYRCDRLRAARAVLECAGVHDILAKSLGSDNAINVVHATVAALKLLQRPEEVAARRGSPIEESHQPACCARVARAKRWLPPLHARECPAMAELKITQVRGTVGARWKQRESLRTLGLRKIRRIGGA